MRGFHGSDDSYCDLMCYDVVFIGAGRYLSARGISSGLFPNVDTHLPDYIIS
jgi:hypothetical protein